MLFVPAKDSHSYSYKDACQWIRFQGKIETEKGFSAKGPIYLNVSYQLDDQKAPAVLLVNYPLQVRKYFFVLAPFMETISRAVFVRFHASYDREIRFIYSATADGGRYRSETQETKYIPQHINKDKVDGKTRCGTDLRFETLTLKKHETPDSF